MDSLHPASLMGALRHRQRRFGFTVKAWGFNPVGIRQHGKRFQSKVDTNTMFKRAHRRLCHFDHNIEKPIAPAVLGKACPIFDLAFRQRARGKHAKGMARKAERIALAVQVTSFEWHPTQRFSAAITQERPTMLSARFGKLLAYRIDGAGVQPKFLAAARGQHIQVKAGQPWAVKTQGILLPIVAIVPDEIHLAGQLVKQPVQRLNTVAVNDNHTVILYSAFNLERTTASQSAPFLPVVNDGVSRSKI